MYWTLCSQYTALNKKKKEYPCISLYSGVFDWIPDAFGGYGETIAVFACHSLS